MNSIGFDVTDVISTGGNRIELLLISRRLPIDNERWK